MVEKEPPTPGDSDRAREERVKPERDGPKEIEDAALQESESPEDETNEG